MRTGEVHGLKWKYVDFANRLILIRETFVLGEDEYTKTDWSQREIQMSQVVFDALQRQQAATGRLSEYVFCNRQGKPLDNKNFTDRVWYPLPPAPTQTHPALNAPSARSHDETPRRRSAVRPAVAQSSVH